MTNATKEVARTMRVLCRKLLQKHERRLEKLPWKKQE
jgi:hypothetical protein